MKYINKIVFFLFVSLIFVINVNAFEFSEINSKNVYLYDLDNREILFEKNSSEKVPIASLTKIMTVITALDKIDDIDEYITLNDKMFLGLSGASVAGFKSGSRVTYLDLLYGAMLPSGADAVQALAISVSGSIDSYVELMNKRAKELGLNNTNFMNVTGLDEEGQYSTVEDVFILLKYALNNETFKKIYTSKSYTTTNGLTMYSTLTSYSKNTNLSTKYILGSKTGFTNDAGLCMASLSNTREMNLVLITCGAPVDADRTNHIKDALNVFKYYNDNFKEITLIEDEQLIASIKTKYDKNEYIKFYMKGEIKKIVPNTIKEEDLDIKYKGINLLTTKNKINEKLGVVSVKYSDDTFYTTDIILKNEIKFNIFRFIKVNWLIILVILLLILFMYARIVKKLKRRKKYLMIKKHYS
jgi:D-alanyl-D-alanine carboxypeptidase